MGFFNRKPSTNEIDIARDSARNAQELIDYAKRTLAEDGKNMTSKEVQWYRANAFEQEQKLRAANQVLNQQKGR